MPTRHPIFVVIAVAVVAPLLAEIPIGVRVPTVVLEVVLGILIGPHVLGLVQSDGFLSTMQHIGTAAVLFMAGMEGENGSSDHLRMLFRLPIPFPRIPDPRHSV